MGVAALRLGLMRLGPRSRRLTGLSATNTADTKRKNDSNETGHRSTAAMASISTRANAASSKVDRY